MKIPLASPVFDDEMKKAAVDALCSERFVLGESVFRFEEEFARYCGVKYAVSTSSGLLYVLYVMCASLPLLRSRMRLAEVGSLSATFPLFI